jgi:hypothetical protein
MAGGVGLGLDEVPARQHRPSRRQRATGSRSATPRWADRAMSASVTCGAKTQRLVDEVLRPVRALGDDQDVHVLFAGRASGGAGGIERLDEAGIDDAVLLGQPVAMVFMSAATCGRRPGYIRWWPTADREGGRAVSGMATPDAGRHDPVLPRGHSRRPLPSRRAGMPPAGVAPGRKERGRPTRCAGRPFLYLGPLGGYGRDGCRPSTSHSLQHNLRGLTASSSAGGPAPPGPAGPWSPAREPR